MNKFNVELVLAWTFVIGGVAFVVLYLRSLTS